MSLVTADGARMTGKNEVTGTNPTHQVPEAPADDPAFGLAKGSHSLSSCGIQRAPGLDCKIRFSPPEQYCTAATRQEE